jgi:hypothetical protein
MVERLRQWLPMSGDTYRFLLDLLVRNEWRNIGLLRASVKSCCQAVFAENEDRDTLAMVTSELLENAVKYGAWADSRPNVVRLHVVGEQGMTRVMVQSPVDMTGGHVAALMDTLAWLDSFDSPEHAYMARLQEMMGAVDEGGDAMESSKLGLVRIAYEGNCSLRAEVDEAGTLSVTAIMPRPPRSEARV